MNCYVVTDLKNVNYPPELDKENTLFYPESGMSTLECFTSGRPADFHIVTDCPYLVSLYSKHEVFIWENGKWCNVDFQTYGCSFSIIINRIWKYHSTIPQAVIDGKITNVMGHPLK